MDKESIPAVPPTFTWRSSVIIIGFILLIAAFAWTVSTASYATYNHQFTQNCPEGTIASKTGCIKL